MRKIFPVLVLFFIRAELCFSQQYNFINYSVSEGLVNSQVNRIAQDTRGYLLFATAGGVSSFNGKEFKNYSKSNGLPGNSLSSIISDADGNVLMATESGLAIFNGKNFAVLKVENELPSENILSLCEDKNGNIWTGTSEGLCTIKNNSGKYSVQKILLSESKTISFGYLYEDKDHNMWAGTTQNGIYFFEFNPSSVFSDTTLSEIASEKISVDGKSCSVFHFNNSNVLCGNIIRTIYQDDSGTMWIGCWRSGITKISAKGIFNYSSKEKNLPLSCDRIWAVQEDKAGNLWFATDGFGVDRISKDSTFERKNIQEFTVGNGLPSNHIFSIFLDREENLWFGTYNGGVSKLSDVRFVNYLGGIRGVEKNILSVFQDKTGNYWFGTFGGGAFMIDGKKGEGSGEMKNYSWDQGISESGVSAINQTNDGILLFGTIGGGISILDPANLNKPGIVFSALDKNNGLPFNFITSLYKDSNGNIWAGSEEGGVSRITFSGTKPVKIVHISQEKGLSSNQVSSIYEDTEGKIWIGTSEGVSVIVNPEKIAEEKPNIIIYSKKNGLASNNISAITSDKLGRIWLGTSGDGIIICGGGSAMKKFISVTDGLTTWQISSFVQDENGNIWVGTNQGINRISVDYRGNITLIKKYTKAEGFTTMECYANSAIRDKKGNLWFGTSSGATKYLREADSPNMFEPVTQITGVKLNFTDTNWEKYKGDAEFNSLTPWFGLPANLVLPYYENRITFNFIAASVRSPEKVQYQFYLEGLDNGWNPVTKENYASYSSIPPGEYIFYLKAANCDDVWNKHPVTFRFFITPPFWKTKWFIFLCFAAAVVIVILIIRIRERQMKLQKKRLEQQVKMRTAEVVEQKDIIEKKNRHITQNINYAKRIQDAILPEVLIKKSFPESFVFHVPKEIVSGDFYWFGETTKDGNTLQFIAVADCTGHGVPGAFMSMIGNDALNYVIMERGITKPSEILKALNDKFCASLRHDTQQETRDGMDIAICAIDKKNKTIQYAGAHRPLYIVEGKTSFLKEIKASPVTVGRNLTTENPEFENHTLHYFDGDKIYLFTDGYTDQFGGADDEKFMLNNFKENLITLQGKSMVGQRDSLRNILEEWKGSTEQLDDVLIIGLKL